MSITIELPAELEMRLRELARKEGKAPEQYVAGLIRAKTSNISQEAASLSAEESRLFEIINKGFPDTFWKRLHALDAKRQKAIITELELTELISLTEQLDTINLDRIKALTRLAQLRNTDLDHLMHELGLTHGEPDQAHPKARS